MKIKVNIPDFIQLFVELSKVSVFNIEDYKNFLIVDFVKNEKINFLKKIETAKETNKKEITVKMNRATGAAIYNFITNFETASIEQKLNFATISDAIHKKLIDSLAVDFETLELPEAENFKQISE